MSAFDTLTDEQRIRLAKEAVKYRVPIAPQIVTWLHANGLYDQITNPRKMNVSKESTDATPAATA